MSSSTAPQTVWKKSISRLARLDVQHGSALREITVRQSVVPVAVASLLFFGWGFAYGLLDTMNAKVRDSMSLQGAQAALMAVTYYAAYVFTPFLVAGPLIRSAGYRLTFVLGLSLFGVGNFVVSEGARLVANGDEGYSIMVLGMYVVGSGISTLERSANTYVVHCGAPKWASLRLNLAQAAAAIGTVVAPLLAAAIIFNEPSSGVTADIVKRGDDGMAAMASVVQLYRICGSAVLGITVVCTWIFFRFHIVPEVASNPHDTDTDEGSKESDISWWRRTLQHPVWNEDRLWFASTANFFNLGCQVAVAQFFIGYCQQVAGMTHARGAHMLSIAQGFFVVGRLVMAGLCRFVKPRKVLLVFILGAIASTAATAVTPGIAGVICAISVMFFEGPLFPTIFATADVVADRYSSLREDIMISSISGGAVLSPLVGALSDGIAKRNGGKGDALAFFLVAAGFGIVASYVVAINARKKYRAVIDATANTPKGDDTELAASPCPSEPTPLSPPPKAVLPLHSGHEET